MLRRPTILSFLIIVQFLVFAISDTIGQTSESPILFIYDASGSMWGKIDGEFKKEMASKVLTETIDLLALDQKIGLIAYGHRSKSDCQDVELLVDLENKDKFKLKSIIKSINPTGKTPLAYSAKIAINKIKASQSKTTIILVTDGIESCNGDLCEIIQLAKKEGIEFKLHIVGFGLKDEELANLKCAAKEGGGNYFDAKDANQLSKAMTEAVNQKIDDPISNHTFYTIKNGLAVDAWIKILDKNSGKEIRGVRTYKDTAQMYLPIGEYQLTINPLEGTDIASKKIDLTKTKDGDTHSTFSFEGGKLEVFVSNNGEGWDSTVQVFSKGSKTVVSGSRTYGRKTIIELNEGTYDIELLPLNIKGATLKHIFKDVKVGANKLIPLTHDYKTGILTVGVMLQSGELIDAVVTVNDNETKEYVTGTRTYTSSSSNPKSITILPGIYEIKISTLGAHKGTSMTDLITVSSGKESKKIFKIE